MESLGQGSLLAFVGQLLNLAILFGVRVALVHFLTVQEFGVLTLGISLFTLVQAILNLGLPTAIARQIAHSPFVEERRRIMRVGFWITLVAAIAVPVILVPSAGLLASWVRDPLFAPVLAYLSIYLALVMVQTLLTSFFQGHENVLPYVLTVLVVSPALTLVFLGALLGLGWGLTGAVIAYVIAGAITLAGLVVYTLTKRKQLESVPEGLRLRGGAIDHTPRTTPRSLLLFSLPLALVGLALVVPGNADTLVVGLLQPVEVAGSYNAALALGRLVTLGITSLAFIMLPVAARLHARGDFEELRRSYAVITKWILLLSFPFFLLFVFFPQASLMFLYGDKVATPAYAQAPLVLAVVSSGAFVASLLGPSTAVLTGFGRLGPLVRATAISATIDVVGSFALVPLVGVVGAAIAFSASVVALPALCLAEINSRAVVHPFSWSLGKPLLAVAAVFTPVFVLLRLTGWSPSFVEVPLLFLLIAIGYVIAVPATRSLAWEDGHLLTVVEGYLGRRLVTLRRIGARFVRERRPPPSPPVAPASDPLSK